MFRAVKFTGLEVPELGLKPRTSEPLSHRALRRAISLSTPKHLPLASSHITLYSLQSRYDHSNFCKVILAVGAELNPRFSNDQTILVYSLNFPEYP